MTMTSDGPWSMPRSSRSAPRRRSPAFAAAVASLGMSPTVSLPGAGFAFDFGLTRALAELWAQQWSQEVPPPTGAVTIRQHQTRTHLR